MCDVATIKDGSHKAAASGEEIAQTHEFPARRQCEITFERFHREETFRHRFRPSRDYPQGRITSKGQADQASWYRGREHLLHSPPKRVDVHRAMQAEQGS